MNRLNPTAVVFYGMILLAGYCFGGIHGLGISAVISTILLVIF